MIGSFFVPKVFSETPTSESLTLTIYSDGYVYVEYILNVDPDSPKTNFTVFGEDLLDIVVLDIDGLALEYSINGSKVLVNSLGVEKVKINYFTQDLTQKDGRFWILNITSTIRTTLILPSEATIVDFNKIPELIESNENQVLLIMSAGLIEITYVTSVVGTKEYAQIVINEAEKTITEIKGINIIVTEAETLLQDAKNEFNLGNYIRAETNGKKAKSTAIQINSTATQANTSIFMAKSEIDKAQQEGRTTKIDEANNVHDQAVDAFNSGEYAQALSLASEAFSIAQASTTTFPTIQVIGILSVTGLIVSYFVLNRRKPEPVKPLKVKKPFDVEKIIKNNELRPDEITAVKMIAEAEGEMYEAELYGRLNLPRTTTWRLVKRLEGMGVVEIKKVRRSNVIKLKK